jgi:alpha-beta hydrolase superfamily lysophospholipase
MTWPQATDYNAAVQNPALCFSDADLRQGQVAGDVFGLPRPHAGNFADVYQINTPDGAWAVKCFTRPVEGLHQRYQAISEHLSTRPLPFMVDFVHLDEGIRIRGQWFPIVKMRWVEGLRLNEFVAGCLDKPAVLDRLAQLWVRLTQELREAGMAHGDLQHGNVLLVPGSKAASLALKLIDYDGLFVPALEDQPSGEVGHPNYQHTQRLSRGVYNAEMDRFAHLVIWTALRCLRAGGAELWQRHDSGENLLFREEDFRIPEKSRLWPELLALRDPEARFLAGHLLLASQGPVLAVPLLEELWADGGVRPLTASEVAQARSLIGTEVRQRRKARVPALVEDIPPLPCPLAEGLAPDEPVPAGVDETLPEFLRASTALTTPPLPPDVPPPLPNSGVLPPPLPGAAPSTNGTSPAVPLPRVSILGRIAQAARRMRQHPLVATGVVGGIVLLLALIVAAARRPPTPPPRPTPRFTAPAAVGLVPGTERVVALAVTRDGFMGPLDLEIDTLPDAIQCAGDRRLAPWAEQWRLHFTSRLDADPGEYLVRLTLRADGQAVDEQVLQLTVEPLELPVLGELPRIQLRPGETRSVSIPIERHGFPGQVTLAVDRPPAGIQATSTASPPGQPHVDLRLTAPADAAAETHFLRLVLSAETIKAQEAKLELVIDAQEMPKHVVLAAKGPVSVMAGGKETDLEVRVQRDNSSKGIVQIKIIGLPNGVMADEGSIPDTDDRVVLPIRATADAAAGDYKITLRAWVGDDPVDAQVLELHVARPVLDPPAIVARTDQPQPVTIRTADGVTLKGTFFPGALGKKGATVLLVHELGRGGGSTSLGPLAKALHADGHTVLLMDLRGYGESTEVNPQVFWGVPANKQVSGRMVKGEPTGPISAAHFPPAYLPSLVQDLIAARSHLDTLADDPRSPVNRANLVVIGADEGATLACLWLATECCRYAVVAAAGAAPFGGQHLASDPEAKSIAGAILLTPSRSFGSRAVPLMEWVLLAGRQQLPMVFVYGQADPYGRTLSHQLLQKTIKGSGKARTMSAEAPIPATTSAGVRLLDGDIGGMAEVRSRVHALVKGGRPLSTASYKATSYMWVFGGVNPFRNAKIGGTDAPELLPVDAIRLQFDRSKPGG